MVMRAFFIMLFSALTFNAWAVAFEASIDRNEIAEGDAFVLTLRYNSNTLTGSPDFSQLENDFEIINQKRKSSFQFINGKSESWTIWTIHLMPERLGTLTIPPITFRGETSNKLSIKVNKVSAAIKQQQQKDIFFHTQVDLKTAYVQGQVLYTEKLYFSVPLDNSQLSEVVVEDAMVTALGDIKHYRSQLNGRNFEVYERNFAIFPQISGELIIPGPRYTGEVSNGPWRPGRPLRLSHAPIKLQVLPQPASYPQATWLPAKDVQLNYKWRGEPSNLKVGEPITLELILSAEGLSAAQLPAVPLPDLKRFKYYPDQAQTQEQQNNQGMKATRSQNIAIVPTQAGSITLPEIRLPWWNTQLGRLEHAIIPAQRLTAFGNAATPAEAVQTTNTATAPQLNEPAAKTPEAAPTSIIWPIISGTLLLLWLSTLYLWWKKPRHITQDLQASPSVSKLPLAKLNDIKKACRLNQAEAAREALLSWASHAYKTPINSLSQLADLIDETSLKQALNELDHTLYAQGGNSAWQGEFLWQLIKSHKAANTSKDTDTLAPLYQDEIVQHG